MSFKITPRDFLGMLQELHAEYRADPLSLRKAIAVSMFASHLSEHVFEAYHGVDNVKLEGCPSMPDYRALLEARMPGLKLVRDLCEFGKHVTLRRKTQVSVTEVKETMVLDDASFLLLGVGNHFPEDKIVLSLHDGSERFFDYLIDEVVKFWADLFASRNL